MSGWNHDNANWKSKICLTCEEVFTPYCGGQKYCSEKCGLAPYRGDNGVDKQYERISGNWSAYCSRLLISGGRRRTLSKQDLLDKLEEQDYKCALSGVDMTCLLERGKSFKTNASVDRIIPGGGYTKDNIQLICKVLNYWRSDTDLEEFIDWCRKVAKYHG